MKGFIEVTRLHIQNNVTVPMVINTNTISSFLHDDGLHHNCIIYLKNSKEEIYLVDTYDQVKQKLEQAQE